MKGAEFASVWVGDRFLPLANACLNSFGGNKHSFTLYTYNFVRDVPRFVELREAETIITAAKVFRAHGGWETFADRFAYQYLKEVGGWWVDSDVVCNTDDVPDVEIAFAEEEIGTINNAVLRFPGNHPAMSRLLDYISTVDPENSIWGSTGPLALTKIFNEQGLERHKQPTHDFYPLHWREAPKLFFPEYTAEVTMKISKSPFVHLWGAALREFNFDFSRHAPIEGSYLDSLYKKYLDSHIWESLEPVNEGEFRISVRKYIKENSYWGDDLVI